MSPIPQVSLQTGTSGMHRTTQKQFQRRLLSAVTVVFAFLCVPLCALCLCVGFSRAQRRRCPTVSATIAPFVKAACKLRLLQLASFDAKHAERRPPTPSAIRGYPRGRIARGALVVRLLFLPAVRLLRAAAGARRDGHPGRRRQSAMAVHRNLHCDADVGAGIRLGLVALSTPPFSAVRLSVLRRQSTG